MNLHKIINVSTLAGKIMLENGAETYRVEETIVRICLSFGVSEAESFVTPTGMMVSLTHNSETVTSVKRIKTRGVDLNKIDLVNTLSRQLQTTKMDIDELNDELLKISKGNKYTALTTLIASCFAASGFTVMFNGNLKDFLCAFFIGGCVNIMTTFFQKLNINGFFINCLGGALCSLLAVILMKLNLCANLDATIIGSIMLLVPGMLITNAIRDTIAGDFLSGLTKASEAFLIAISIAVGTGSVLSLFINTL